MRVAQIPRVFAVAAFLLTLIAPILAQDQPLGERTIDEIKVEAVHRAENGMYPMIGLDPADVKDAFTTIKTRDPEEWSAGFMRVGDKYMAEAKSLEKSDPTKANADYVRAWKIYSFGRWPVPSSPGKQESYRRALEAFQGHAKFYDPPMELVKIPFEGKEIIGYMRFPKNAHGPVPMVIAVNGLDSRKEDLTDQFSAILPFGVGYIAVDGPGTGQSPVKVNVHAERALSAVLDYLQTRPEVDKTRIALHGVSWGAYWAMKMSILERDRLKCVSAQSPPAKEFFTEEFARKRLQGNREYLFDQLPAMMSIQENVHNIDELIAMFSKLSLANQGLLGKPTTKTLIIAGVLDTQVPISDIYTLMSSGDVPKTAWINPQGGHLGRQVHVWPDPRIFKEVLIPWLVENLDMKPAAEAH
jgi:pimeloyl-ACP methyl ester carboxylesterase